MFILRAIFGFGGRLLRRLVAVLLFMLIRGRKVVIPAVAVVLLAVFIGPRVLERFPAGTLPGPLAAFSAPGGSASTGAGQAGRTSAPSSTKLGAMSVAAEPMVDSYIKGLTQFDARLMWAALSEDAIQAMRQRGGSQEALQKGLDEAKQRGARYEDITMIGNYPLQDGRKYLFYVLSRRGFTGPDQLEQVYFIFTVSRDGKITRIE